MNTTQEKIDKLQALIDNPKTPETDKKNFQEAIKKFKEKLELENKEKKTSKPVVKKETTAKPVFKKETMGKPVFKKETMGKPVEKKSTTSKPVVKKATMSKPKTTIKEIEKKVPKGVQMLSKNKVVVNGKEMSTDSKEFCDYLTDEFIKRKEKAKSKKGSRKKTKSVMEQVSSKIEQGVQKAIKTGISKQIPTLKKNPIVFIGKVQKLETATKNFLKQLKEVLGNDYDAKEVADTTKAIHKMIDDLKKKYSKK
jgi:hypothetical protein